jgi:hypothetical protein
LIRWGFGRFAHRHLARKVRKSAGLPDTISFASFRKGGTTEMGEAGFTDQQILRQSGHKTRQMVSVYARATDRLQIDAGKQRPLYRSRK